MVVLRRTRRARRPINPEAFRYRVLSSWLRISSQARKTSSLLVAFVIGIWVNTASDPNVKTFSQYISQVYNPAGRPTAWLAIIPTTAFVLLPAIRLGLQRTLRRASFAVALAETTNLSIAAELKDYARGRIAWGSQIVLQSCPRIEQGWTPEEVPINKRPTE